MTRPNSPGPQDANDGARRRTIYSIRLRHGRRWPRETRRWRDDTLSVETTRIGQAIVDLFLLKREIVCEDVAHATGATQQAVNHRLRVMRGAGLVQQTRDGRRFRRWAAARLHGAP